MERDQRVRDPVHDLIKFSYHDKYDRLLWKLVQSQPLQRLRRIKQLGFSEFVYPGATHSRLSHSFGAVQMARRMFDAFERNALFKLDEDHETMRAATLAAVLLHDVGHGPYSHVFEEISEHMKFDMPHEAYTRSIIASPEIRTILETCNLQDHVLHFFDRDVRDNPYTAIVSSQLDADRLDFLTRDRYFTGIKVGQIDHEWLFDSLRIEDVAFGVDRDDSRMTFVVEQKGLRVVEDYISAYLKLYESVYFHKTTRGIQFLVEEALKAALNDMASVRDAGILSPVLEYFFLPEDKRFEHYLLLDDSDVLTLMKQLASRALGPASEFSKRFLKREPLRCFEPNDANRDMDMNRTKAFRGKLEASKIWFHVDILKGKGFKAYDPLDEAFLKNIMIKVDSQQTRPIGQVDPDVITNARLRCRFYFLTEKDRASAKKIWRDE